MLLPIVDAFARDRWDRAYLWRLFRLACCQRRTGDASGYLNTLTRCFNRRLSAVAAPRTANLLQDDLEAVVGEPAVSGYRLGISPFLETDLVLEPTPQGKSSHPLGYLRKKLVRHYVSVGETTTVALAVTSHLPRPIRVDSIRLMVLTNDRYQAVHRTARGLVKEEDSFRVLSVDRAEGNKGTNSDYHDAAADDGRVTIRPGDNVFKFIWTPMTVGQYILSTVVLRWKSATFHYDAFALRRPVLGVDVLPSEPTQTIELNPLFLIPGHVQTVRLVFHSGSDVVKNGSVELACSDGLTVIPPGTDPNDPKAQWSDQVSMSLEPCGPGSEIVLTTSVRSEAESGTVAAGIRAGTRDSRNGDDDFDDSHDEDVEVDSIMQRYGQKGRSGESGGGGAVPDESLVQTMRAKVVTSYQHPLHSELVEGGKEPESEPMTTILEAMVTTLDRPALTVSGAKAFSYGNDRVVVSASLLCNTPVPFFLKEWDVVFPPPLVLAEDGGSDLNVGLFGHAVAEGEELFFGFRCDVRSDSTATSDPGVARYVAREDQLSSDGNFGRPILQVVLQDEFGKTFRQVLPLDLDEYYRKLRGEQDELAGQSTASAELTCEVEEGVVGGPIRFAFRLDLAEVARRGSSLDDPFSPSLSCAAAPIQYAVTCRGADWILSGTVQGTIDPTSDLLPTLEFVGIPTRSGVLRHFPEIELRYLQSSSGSTVLAAGRHRPGGAPPSRASLPPPPIAVRTRHPDSFRSLSYTHHMALACAATVEV